jgi:hypothetical protein
MQGRHVDRHEAIYTPINWHPHDTREESIVAERKGSGSKDYIMSMFS